MEADATAAQNWTDTVEVSTAESSAPGGDASVVMDSPLPGPHSSLVAVELTPMEFQACSVDESCIDTLPTHSMSTRQNYEGERHRNKFP
jgi:hypothetical protein